MKKTFKSNLILLILIILLTLYLVNSQLILTAILEYTNLFLTKLFPTSFLIYIIASLLINYGLINELAKFNKHPAITYILIISIISGFPSGPKYIKDLFEKGYLDTPTSNYLLTFTHFPNPLFVLGSISSIVSFNIALKILLSIILSNLIISFLFRKNKTASLLPQTTSTSFSKCLSDAILSSLKTLLLVYGTSVFFYIISFLITTYFNFSPLFYVLITGFFDLTKGIFSTTIISSTLLKAVLIIIFITMGSASIHIQIKSILSDTNLNYKNFLSGRIISTFLSLIIFFILLQI